MVERYVSLGAPADWRFYLPMGLFLIAIPFALVRFIKIGGQPRNPLIWASVGSGVATVIIALAGLPQAWVSMAIPISYAVAALFPTKTSPTMARLVLVPVMLAFACFDGWIQMGHHKIALGEKSGLFRENWRFTPNTIRRDGLAIIGYHNIRTDAANEYGWSVARANGSGMPNSFRSDEIFWGPHGIVRGNQVAKRIADWAGVKPEYDTYSM